MAVSDYSLKQNAVFLKSTFKRSVFPAMLSILSANINVFVDGILVGNRLGTDALAAISLCLPLSAFLCVIGSFFSSGTAINAARAIGDDDPQKSQMYYRSCVVIMFFVSLAFTALGLVFSRQLVAFLCADSSIRPYVSDYVVITVIGALPKIMLYIPFWYLRLDGKNAAVALIMAVMSVGNIILDVVFIYFLDMGVFGAGLASVIATAAAFILGMFLLFGKKCSFVFKPFLFREREEWKVILADGVPSALNNLLSTVRIFVINAVLLRFGGSGEVAVFAAVNGIAGFGECITLGIPQAASPMLGVFCGEQDNESCKLLIRLEIIAGAVFSAGFIVLCLALSEPIRMMYGLTVPMLIPLLWLSLSVFPGLICTVVSGYYNMAGKNIWSTGIIFLRGIVMTCIGLWAVIGLGLSTYLFLLISEASTLLIWFAATGAASRRNEKLTRYLLMDTSLEEQGSVLSFSVSSSPEDICRASELISGFCEDNGMDRRTTMRVQLAMEEIMTLIASVNGEAAAALSFDLRIYRFEALTGIRIRYAGIEFNPFRDDPGDNEDEMYMGIMMLKKMIRSRYQRTFGVNTLQVFLKRG